MIDEPKQNLRYPYRIASACLFPLFFFSVILLCCDGGGDFLVFLSFINIICSLIAIFILIRWWRKEGTPQKLWFWLLMIFSLPGFPIAFLLDQLIPYACVLIIPFFLIQVFFPAIHIVMEARKRKSLWRNILVCIYIFSLAIGCTILFLGRRCLFEFFPLAALTGILLECSFIRKQKKIEK